ncbi:hypothetical protein GOM49_03385 [Clostridium bovifaecis]|uniref:Tetratricopeptide repeat protein n=1 Tax=Clostridium bovifaecis TaxID=2184719 RepID=A0A6I6F9B8_9CLOT|nr:hypothetical protein GOM49_03385 [Clostridium bovifaecis]
MRYEKRNPIKLVINNAQALRPLYLRPPKTQGRGYIVFGVIISLLGILVPYLLIFSPILVFVGLKFLKKREDKINGSLCEAITLYMKGKLYESEEELERVMIIDSRNIQAKALLGIIQYDKENYKDAISLLGTLPYQYINEEIRLLTALRNSYIKVEEFEKAEEIYSRIKEKELNEKVR